jgi:hypothetical protein
MLSGRGWRRDTGQRRELNPCKPGEAEKVHLPQDKRVTERIDAHLKRLPLARDHALVK